ncbi:MAG: hypothetical protein ACYTG0_28020 [Planctomycetota bacterium]
MASAHAGVAVVYGAMSTLDLALPQEMMPKAKAAIQRALQLDEHLAELRKCVRWGQPTRF